MQAALGLLRLVRPPSSALSSISLAALDGAVPVTDAAVALVEQLVPWDAVLLDIPLDKVEVPCEQRVELEQPGAVDLERLEVGAVASLRGTAAGNDCLYAELLVCTASWLDLPRCSVAGPMKTR